MRLVHAATLGLLSSVALSSCNCDPEVAYIPQKGDLRGVVCATDDGQPMVGALVTVVDVEGNETTVNADASGRFFLQQIPVGDATIRFTDDGAVREGTIAISDVAEAEWIDAQCRPPPPPPAGTVTGCVCNEAIGQMVVGANVFVTTESGSVVVTGTDQNGCFVLDGVPVGTHTLEVQLGIFEETHEVTVAAGETTSLPEITSCEATPPPPPDEAGTITGRVCAPDGETWLAGADVYVEVEGGLVQTTTDADGNYTLNEVPVGRQIVHIVKGSFETTVIVDVFADQNTTVPEDECALQAENLRIAVVTGDYDRVEDVLRDIGIDSSDVDLFDSNFFNDDWVADLAEDYAALSQYDIVFLNCGLGDFAFTSRFFGSPVAVANLQRFVSEGGSVYASDWAYYVVERTWPDFVDFVGDDATGSSAKVGSPQDVEGSITDAQMATALGQTAMEIHYPLDAWVVMENAAPTVTTYIRGDATLDDGSVKTNVPHVVAFRPGAGRVLFTSFHQEPGINPDMERVLRLLIFEL